MRTTDAVQKYLQFLESGPPHDDGAYQEWIHGADALSFLCSHTAGPRLVLVAGQKFFLDSVFIPRRRLAGEYWFDLLQWRSLPSLGWGGGLRARGRSGRMVPAVFSPLEHAGSKLLACGEPLFFWRHFEGRQPPYYVELNQRFAQLTSVHQDHARPVYYKLDERGDTVELVVVVESGSYTICTVDDEVLDYYMLLTDQVLVRCFDTLRIEDIDRSHGGERFEKAYIDQDRGLFAKLILGQREGERPHLGHLHGVQVLRPTRPRQWLMRQLRGEPGEPKQYTMFTIHDWKTGTVREWSCDPTQLGNYFVESDLPLGTSPAFFRPEVLTKYKQNPDKYRLTDTRISCRGSWTLRYDVNSEHQVTALICDLGDLPYSEQLHWKACNEPPKAELSERAMASLRGDWWTDVDPLAELRRLLRDFPSAQHDGKTADIWAPKARGIDATLENLHYVYDNSRKEWEDEIIHLSAAIVDRLQEKALRRVAEAAGCNPDGSARSLSLLKACLEAHGVDPDTVRKIHSCLAELRNVRSSQTAAHGATARPVADWRVDFRQRLETVLEAMQELRALIEAGVFDLPLRRRGVADEPGSSPSPP
jgi:hypothetical protein